MSAINNGSEKCRVKRIGMIVPSSNTVVEPICNRIFAGLEDKVTVHYSRLEVVNVSLEERSKKQFASEIMLNAAKQLAQAKVDVIVWNGTAGSWLGIERDKEICKNIEAEIGIPMSTASIGMINSYKDFNISKLHLVTPYIDEMNEAIIKEYSKYNLNSLDVTGLGITENTEIGSVTKDRLKELCIGTNAVQGEGISVVCTNLAAAWKADEIEEKTGAVLFDSVTAAVREALHLSGLQELKIEGFGKLLNS